MPWTNKQKQIAVRACAAARISDEQRRDMILRNFDHAKLGDGRISSTAPKLDSRDFEQFMAIVENFAGGQVLHFERGYWRDAAADYLRRMRRKAQLIAQQLEGAGRLKPDGDGLRGWIRSRVSQGATDQVNSLDYGGLLALITGLTAYAKQNGVALR